MLETRCMKRFDKYLLGKRNYICSWKEKNCNWYV